MIEYYIRGVDRNGKILPQDHGMTTLCAEYVVAEYRRKYPTAIRICLDLAFDDTKDLK